MGYFPPLWDSLSQSKLIKENFSSCGEKKKPASIRLFKAQSMADNGSAKHTRRVFLQV
jgi:hypothetical protein